MSGNMGKQSRLRTQNRLHSSQEDEITRLREENAKLRRDLERRDIWAHAPDAGATEIDKEIEQLQIKCENLQKQYDNLLAYAKNVQEQEVIRHFRTEHELRQQLKSTEQDLQKYAPMEAIGIRAMSETELKEHSDEWRPWTGNTCIIAYRFAIRHGPKSQDVVIANGWAPFPGTQHEATAEISTHIDSVIRRAPLPREVKRVGLVGVTDKTLHYALMILAPYWQDDDLSSEWDKKFSQAFEEWIWPEVQQGTPKGQALDEFGRSQRKTFRELPGTGRSIARTRRRKRGPKYRKVRV